jgi:hypothetical protein
VWLRFHLGGIKTVWQQSGGGVGTPNFCFFFVLFYLILRVARATAAGTSTGVLTGCKQPQATHWLLAKTKDPVNRRLQGFFFILLYFGNVQ